MSKNRLDIVGTEYIRVGEDHGVTAKQSTFSNFYTHFSVPKPHTLG